MARIFLKQPSFAPQMAGIYIHIPFCRRACTYCNFHFSTSLKLKDEVVTAMLREIELQQPYLAGQPIETIYFGGGTPSLLDIDDIKRIIDKISSQWPTEQLQECTLEANPDDLTLPYLKELKTTPINRFSIGVQSFKEADLKYMNRAHTAQQADYAIKASQDLGFENLSIDLIYGTPGLTDADWKYNLNQVKTLGIPHFSSYALTVEEGTALYHSIKKKAATPVDPDQAAGQFEILMEAAEAMGYEHYEISNLALPHKYAIHNTNYWRGKPYLGIGPSAHSFDGRNRRWNIANNALYAKSILADSKLTYEEETLTPEQQLNEYIMTSLRTQWGCSLPKVRHTWSAEEANKLLERAQPYIDKGLLTRQGDNLVLTSRGKLFADNIAGNLFA
ncbi:radical SAM family heme chaperone HemW [Polluticoccus soli]|uniref:radical SAM family heme chaperone HemW n=1 Tax=Polluticoccus soli TaxID=3034150 RepID=UPI0023E0E476|nr:radical SAM family heme chaperone HemW [Flavipsychrobacter sp. JY13-12]